MLTNGFLHLDRNENMYGPAPACFEALHAMGVNELSLYSRDFHRGVKSVLSERLASELRVSESQVLLGEGSEDLLKQSVHCYLGPGDRILCPAQSWWYYQALASEVGGETVTYTLRHAEDTYAFDVDEMISLYQKVSPRIVLIASPNNPTGNSFPDSQLDEIIAAFRESIVILDEAYWGYGESTDGRISAFAEKYKNLILLRTFSKFYALAGARIGFAVVGKSLGGLTKFATRYLGYNRVSEQLALAALNSPVYYEAMKKNVCADRQMYREMFGQLKGFKSYRSDANFLLVRVHEGITDALQKFLTRRKIIVRFYPEGEFADSLRITIGTTDQNELVRKAIVDFSSQSQ